MDSNHRSNLQQIYSLSPLATRESTHSSRITAPDNIVLYTILFQKSRDFLLNFDLFAEQTHPKRADTLYLWPRSKGWMRALKANIQTAATKVTNIGGRLSSGASFCLRQIPIYISSFFLFSLRFASSLSSTYNTAVTGIANIIPIAPKRLPPINAALNVQSGASPTEPPTTLG